VTGRHHAARVRRLLTAALLGPVLAACGSTVEAGQQATGGGGLSYTGGAAGTNSGGAPSSTGNGAGFAPGAVGAPGGPSYAGNGTAPGASGTSTVGGTNPSQGATSAGGHDTSAIRVGFELIQGGNLSVYPDAAVRLAISRAVAIESPRGWRIAKEKQSHKIDVVVALGMAAHACVAEQGSMPMRIPAGVLQRIRDMGPYNARRTIDPDQRAGAGMARLGERRWAQLQRAREMRLLKL